MAKNYPALYTILVWLGIVAFGFMTFYGLYILSFVPEIPISNASDAEVLIQTGAAIGATSLIFLSRSLWRYCLQVPLQIRAKCPHRSILKGSVKGVACLRRKSRSLC